MSEFVAGSKLAAGRMYPRNDPSSAYRACNQANAAAGLALAGGARTGSERDTAVPSAASGAGTDGAAAPPEDSVRLSWTGPIRGTTLPPPRLPPAAALGSEGCVSTESCNSPAGTMPGDPLERTAMDAGAAGGPAPAGNGTVNAAVLPSAGSTT